MFNHPALQELFKIVKINDYEHRIDSLNVWKAKWVLEVDASQLVVNKSVMSSSDHDFTCEHVAHKCIDQLIENNAFSFDIEKNSYKTKVSALRYPKKSVSSNEGAKKGTKST